MGNMGRSRAVLKFAVFLAVLGVCWGLGRVFHLDVAALKSFLSGYPVALSGLIFVLLYVGATTFIWWGPKDVLRISSAILFGAVASTVFVWVAEMINAFIMFHLSRSLGREYVHQRFQLKDKSIRLMREDISLLAIAAWRSNPLVPFRFMDLGYGLTRVSFRKYFFVIVGITLCRVFWLQFILEGIGTSFFKDTSAMMDYFLDRPAVLTYSMFYFLGVMILSVAALAARSLRRRKEAKALLS